MGRNKRPGSLLSGLPASVLSSIRRTANSVEDNSIVGTKRPTETEEHTQSRPAKRQKVQKLLGLEWEKYDATDIVPFYQKHKDVPENLKKCESRVRNFCSSSTVPFDSLVAQISISENAISHSMTRDVS